MRRSLQTCAPGVAIEEKDQAGSGSRYGAGSPFRMRRLKLFLSLVDRILERQPQCRVLDVGGESVYWRAMRDLWSSRNIEITIVNIAVDAAADEPGMTHVVGNACNLDRYANNSFDVVHSNSVIEHVGMWKDMQAMAAEVRRLAPSYFVQTPNYWFPQEPHLRVPFIHWLPRPLRQRIVMARACGAYPRARDVEQAQKILADASLLDMSMMCSLFPDARIEPEKFGPLTKSLIAIRG